MMDHSETSELTFKKLSFKLEKDQKTCEKHGDYEASIWRGHVSQCQECTKEIDEKTRRDEQKKKESEYQARVWAVRLGRAAIPERFADRTLENYLPTCSSSKNALEIAQSFVSGFIDNAKLGRCLIFCGGVGTGKTHLAIGIANAIMTIDKQPVFISVIKAIRKIKETYSRDIAQTEDEAIKSFIDPDLLILDEVGVQFGSETEKMYLFEIINGRYERLKPTIIISNLGLKDLENFIGSRVMDRLREGGGKAIVFDWQSYRRSV
jgi:DNA replication protein DnaC